MRRRQEKVKIIDILRLAETGMGHRAIGSHSGCGKTTISRLLKRCREKGITHEIALGMPETELQSAIYPESEKSKEQAGHHPDWQAIHDELTKHPNLNLQFMWEEYREQNPTGKSYSWFCDQYRKYRKAVGRGVSLYHERKAGELMEVDWAGKTLACIVDAVTGEVTEAHFFVATLGYSHYPYVEAFPNEKEQNWIRAHVNALTYFGGVPRIISPDNCKTAVKTPKYYEPVIHSSYWELAQHYAVAIVPARVRKPKDKPAVEGGVGWLETWLYGKLRNQKFFNYPELNRAIMKELPELVRRAFQEREGSRYSEFIRIDKPALRPLPAVKYELADVKVKRVGDYYHLEYDGFYYSVPYTLHRQQVILRATTTTIEVMNKNHERVSSHVRRYNASEGRYATVLEHMPPNHQAVHQSRKFDGERYRSWAKAVGPNTYFVLDTLLKSGKVEEQGYRSCMGLLQMTKTYGNGHLEAACERARQLGSPTYTTVKNILKSGALEMSAQKPKPTPKHENIRGSGYYN
jgi:transposase